MPWEKSTVAKDNPWANSVESKQRVLPACQRFSNAYVQSFTFISAKKLPKLREDHREMVKISRHCGCQCQGCNGHWERDLGKEIRLCRINENEHPMEDQWAMLVWSSCHQCQKTCSGVGVLWQFCCQWLWIGFFQLLALTAGLVSQLNFNTCSCPPASLFAHPWNLSGAQPVSSWLVFALSTFIFPGKCAWVCFHNYTCTERLHTRGRSEDEFGSTEVESISKSCSSYYCPLLLHNCLGWAVYYFRFCQEQQ